MKKFFAIICIAAIICLTFAGCAQLSQPTTTGNGNEITTNPVETENGGGTTTKPDETENKEIEKMYVTVYANKFEVTLESNSSVDALVEILKQGDLIFTATENGGFEIYGNIGHTLPTNNSQMTAQAGDVILYAGNNICLFFGNNSWSYTKIGKINGYSQSELSKLLGADNGTVQVTLSLN